MFGMLSTLIALIAILNFSQADLYLQNPRGNNNRHSEENQNRNNANRLFDSQNNGAGGYCFGPSMSFYEGSILSIEWTAQHGCGYNPNLYCNIVIQYMCSSSDDSSTTRVRDGSGETTDTIPNEAGASKIVDNDGSLLYGLNEPFSFRNACELRSRNRGLYIADRNLGERATSTRQNNNANRHGYECPEERDYYPYWHPNPWMDIAVLVDPNSQSDSTSIQSVCSFYQQESQNVKDKNYCDAPLISKNDMFGNALSNNEKDCKAEGGKWMVGNKWNLQPPDCVVAPTSRDNHLGNGNSAPTTNSYNWTLPRVTDSNENNPLKCIADDKCNCVLRLRYNISTGDVGADSTPHSPGNKPFLDWTKNLDNAPIKNNPTIEVDGVKLELAVDTSQFGRTFQDRSFVFHIRPRPSYVLSTARIHNLNVRGKRGNIVQTYPATEYDFVPSQLNTRVSDYVHFQWTGCDNNPQGNAGEGTSQTDRSNIVQLQDSHHSTFITDDWITENPNKLFFEEQSTRKMFSFLNQKNCKTREQLEAEHQGNQNAIEEDVENCMKLNAASQYFDGGLIKMNKTGNYWFASSRNNNFSNRSQKGNINVFSILPTWAIIVVCFGFIGFLFSGFFAGLTIFSIHYPHSFIAQMISK